MTDKDDKIKKSIPEVVKNICLICFDRGGWLEPCPKCGKFKKPYEPVN